MRRVSFGRHRTGPGTVGPARLTVLQLEDNPSTAYSPISTSVSIQTLRRGSSGFSAALTIARTSPSVRGTFLSSRDAIGSGSERGRPLSEDARAYSLREGSRRWPEPEGIREWLTGLRRGESRGEGGRIMTTRNSRKASSRSRSAFASRVKVLSSSLGRLGHRVKNFVPDDQPFHPRTEQPPPQFPIHGVSQHPITRRTSS